jgi:hypothetical protein
LKPTVSISFPNGATATTRGNSVRIEVTTPFKLLPILGIGTINLRGTATMRIEQNASRYVAGAYTPGACT